MISVRNRRIAVAAVVVAAATVIAVYYAVDPASSFMPRCAFKALTGLDCPGCGSQRAFHALLHGRVAEAFEFNPSVFVSVPLAVVYAAIEWSERPGMRRLRRVMLSAPTLMTLACAILLWTIFRNLV